MGVDVTGLVLKYSDVVRSDKVLADARKYLNKDISLREVLVLFEKEINEMTYEFLNTKNKDGIRLVSGLSNQIYLPNYENNFSYCYKVIGGYRNREMKDKIDENTLFDVASITKLFTLLLLLRLCDLGYMSLNDKVRDVNSDFNGLNDFTFNDLVRLHGEYRTIGNVASASNVKEAYERLYSLHLVSEDRTRNKYNDFGAIVIADSISKVMSRICGRYMSFSDILSIYLLYPLGIYNTMFNPKSDNISGQGSIKCVHDRKTRALGGESGAAGLFTNAKDLCLLSDEIFKSMIGKSRTIKKDITQKLGEVTFPSSSQFEKGNLGVYVKSFIPYSSYVPNVYSKGSFAHQGWTGSATSFDVNRRIHQSILVNAIYESDDKEKIVNDKVNGYTPEFKNFQNRMAEIALEMRILINIYNKYFEDDVKEDKTFIL